MFMEKEQRHKNADTGGAVQKTPGRAVMAMGKQSLRSGCRWSKAFCDQGRRRQRQHPSPPCDLQLSLSTDSAKSSSDSHLTEVTSPRIPVHSPSHPSTTHKMRPGHSEWCSEADCRRRTGGKHKDKHSISYKAGALWVKFQEASGAQRPLLLCLRGQCFLQVRKAAEDEGRLLSVLL
ncbi:unnamed protein product [Rangifer tarandus platyrhynchus]|uniref:Uncharacterized protein n=1 Tax=Rangifer tarandus platyrhynchus TaxID=3082113 RepID=A0AC59Z2Q6_RANTA